MKHRTNSCSAENGNSEGRHGSRSSNSRAVSRTSSLFRPSPDALGAHPSLLSFQEPGLSCQRCAPVAHLFHTPHSPPQSPRLLVGSGKTPFPLTSPQRHLGPTAQTLCPLRRRRCAHPAAQAPPWNQPQASSGSASQLMQSARRASPAAAVRVDLPHAGEDRQSHSEQKA